LQLEVHTTYSPQLDAATINAQRIEGLLRSLPKADEAALADPARRFELLVKQYQADYGRQTPLTPAALAFSASRKSERTPESADIPNRRAPNLHAMGQDIGHQK
jgi:hypothetical protein